MAQCIAFDFRTQADGKDRDARGLGVLCSIEGHIDPRTVYVKDSVTAIGRNKRGSTGSGVGLAVGVGL